MSQVSDWTVRELKKYLQTNGINPNKYKQKTELIHRVSSIIAQHEQAEFNKNMTAILIVIVTFLFLNVFFRKQMRKLYWLNPKYVGSYLLLSFIWIYEKLLAINMICSWILPPTAKEYNFIDTYFVKSIQPFPLSIPMNWDSTIQDASMWIDVFPMLLLYFLRNCKQYVSFHWHYYYFNQFRDGYYDKLGADDRAAEDYRSARIAVGNFVQNTNIQFMNQDGETYADDEKAAEFQRELQEAIIRSMKDQGNDGKEFITLFHVKRSESLLSEPESSEQSGDGDDVDFDDVD